jgi:2-haloalkanoic acid dehalogenase type II
VSAPFKAVLLDAYGTLIRNEDLTLLARRLVDDHRLTVPHEDVYRLWVDLYHEATQATPFQTLRAIQEAIFRQALRRYGAVGDATPYVDLFFEVTTKVELYPEVLPVLTALAHVPLGILSNADHEHVAAWTFTLPVQFILISEELGAYQPHALAFQRAVERLGLAPREVLHVGDSDVDDVKGAKAAGLGVAWVNRNGRPRRADVPAPDYEVRDLTGLLPLFER